MNKLYFIPILLLICRIAIGQGTPYYPPIGTQTINATTSKNYVKTITYKDTTGSTTTAKKANIDISYFDGLGRPIQQIGIMASPAGKDVVTHMEYDDYGRKPKDYLSFAKGAVNNGSYIVASSAIDTLKGFIDDLYGSSNMNYGFSETTYENSPINRVESQASPGYAWRKDGGYEVEFDYKTNTSSVSSWKYSGSSYSAITYATGTLYITETTDEDGHMSREYTDFEGKIVMKEVYGSSYLASNTWHKTRYCYDDFGLLRCVIQPKGSSPSSTDYCFYYKYDGRKRMTDKKIPGADWVYMVYDNKDLLVATQDGVQRAKTPDEWSFIRYDDLNREYRSGTFVSSLSRDSIESYAEAGTLFSNVGGSYKSYFYYDTYGQAAAIDGTFHTTDGNALGVTPATDNTGRLTQKDESPNIEFGLYVPFITTYFYDKYGRLIQTQVENQEMELEHTTYKYSFDGLLIQKRERQDYGSTSNYVDYYYDYDHRGRLKTTSLAINGGTPFDLSASVYNEAGMLAQKYLHDTGGTDCLQRIDYAYNIRGWLTDIDDPGTFSENDKFGMKLYYDNPVGGLACYNGNISNIKWGNSTNGHDNLLYYLYYDRLNRLKTANYAAGTLYDCSYVYDKNGNPVHFTRYNGSSEEIDDLWYANTGNKINWIDDAASGLPKLEGYPGTGTGFTYDQSGNLTYEPVKDVSLSYTRFNLPEELNFANDQKTSYIYLPDGTKRAKEVEDTQGNLTLTEYCGNFIWETVSGTRSLKYILTPEGRIIFDSNGSVDYLEYHLKDHLGNVRVALKDDGTVLQENHYYPFGMAMSELDSSNTTNDNLYMYNGKEFQNDFDLGWYDYGARFYEPSLGRWHSVDPLAEELHNLGFSPFNYCVNNPILYIDPNGEDWFVNDVTGSVLYLHGVEEISKEVYDKLYKTLSEQGLADGVDYAGMLSNEGSMEHWQNFGADDMFDTQDFKISEGGNQLMFEDVAERFMNNQGFEKAVKEKIKETDIEMWSNPTGTSGGGRYDNIHKTEVIESDVTYSKGQNYGIFGYSKLNFVNNGIKADVENYTRVCPYYDKIVASTVFGIDFMTIFKSSYDVYGNGKKK